jgi:hypothetical protein
MGMGMDVLFTHFLLCFLESFKNSGGGEVSGGGTHYM